MSGVACALITILQIRVSNYMPWIVKNLWLIPFLPMLAAGISALAPQETIARLGGPEYVFGV